MQSLSNFRTAALCLWLAMAGASEAAGSGADAELDAFRERFRQVNPNTRVDAVARTPVAGLYEVQAGRNLVYVDASGRYALFGSLYDFKAGRDLTADRKALLDRVDAARLPRELAVRTVRGNGRRVLFQFADPQCSFCRQQEQALHEVDDVTVYTYVVPLLGPESRRLAEAIGCARDPSAAWADWMLRGQRPEPIACASSVDAVLRLARELGVDGTPTAIAADGRRHTGLLAPQALQAMLVQPPLGGPEAR